MQTDTTRTRPSSASAPELLAQLAREAETTGVTPGIDSDLADALHAAVHDGMAHLRTNLRPASSRCEDPHRLMLKNGSNGMVVPRLCGNVRCPACGIWRRACAVLTVEAALRLESTPEGVWIVDLDPSGWDALRQALHRAGAEYALVRLQGGHLRVLATCRMPGDDDARFVPAEELTEALEDFFSAAEPGTRGTRPWRWSRRWGRVHAILREALSPRGHEDWELVAVGRGIPDTTLREVLRAHGARISADDLREGSPVRGQLLYELPPPLSHEGVARDAGYSLLSQPSQGDSPRGVNRDRLPVRAPL